MQGSCLPVPPFVRRPRNSPGCACLPLSQRFVQLARSLGVEQVAVVITKLDTCDFDQARFESIK